MAATRYRSGRRPRGGRRRTSNGPSQVIVQTHVRNRRRERSQLPQKGAVVEASYNFV